MGADLYINGYQKHHDAIWPKLQALYEERNLASRNGVEPRAGINDEIEALDNALHSAEWYFRDSYNPSSVFWSLGLSWWQDLEPFLLPVDKQTEDVNIDADGCRRLRELVEKSSLKIWTPEMLKQDRWNKSPEVVNAYFAEKKERLLRFLSHAIEAGGLSASV